MVDDAAAHVWSERTSRRGAIRDVDTVTHARRFSASKMLVVLWNRGLVHRKRKSEISHVLAKV